MQRKQLTKKVKLVDEAESGGDEGSTEEELSKRECATCDLEVCTEDCFNAHPGSTIALTKLLNSLNVKAYITGIDSEDEETLAPVNPSGVELGEEIKLEEIMGYFKSFYHTKPYVSLVGGICNWGKTKGDIDFFINTTHRDTATEFRIYRMFPQDYWRRFRFLYPDESHPGKFTNHIDIFNEKIESISAPELVLMSAQKKVELFKFAKLLKPAFGRYKGEMYSIDSLIELVNTKPDWYEKKIVINVKYDGVHCRADYKKEGAIKIWTEEGNEITDKLPTIVSELKEICKGHDVIVVGEIESWKDKKHMARQLTAGIIHSKGVHEEEKTLRFNIFDCLYFEDDKHSLDHSERLKFLDKLPNSKHIIKAENKIVDNAKDLRAAVTLFASREGSEGAYLKIYNGFPYELDGKTQQNLKYKNTFSIEAEVKEIHKVKDSDAWNYLCTIKDVNGRDVPVGRTYNTGIKLKEGDIVKVSFCNLNKYFDDKIKRTWYSWWSPRVIMAREDKTKPDTTATADKLVEASNGETRNRRANVALDADPYTTLPDETKKLLGMCHVHGRGKSVHGALRFQVSSDYAVSWTLYIPKGLSKVPESFKEFKELVDKEIMPIIRTKLEDPTQKFNCGRKEPEPVEWLDYQGMVQKGEVGASKNEPGFFYIIDRFDVEFGTQKSHFHEYFCHGNLFNGRVVVRLLENKESWKKTGEGLMTWMCSVALTEKTPYVISSRAVEKKWTPPYGHSALPANLKSKVPKEYKYWEMKDPKKRLEKRDEFVVEIAKKQLKLDSTGPAKYKILRQTWKGQKVIREGASRTIYYFLIYQNEIAKFGLAFQNNPLKNNELTGLIAKEKSELCKIKKDTSIKPGTKLNPTRETPSEISVLETGNATILSSTNFKRYRIKNGRMNGTWQAYSREDGSVMWTLRKEKTKEV